MPNLTIRQVGIGVPTSRGAGFEFVDKISTSVADQITKDSSPAFEPNPLIFAEAVKNNLTEEQIKRVCEQVNVKIYKKFFDRNKPADIRFELANAAEVCRNVKRHRKEIEPSLEPTGGMIKETEADLKELARKIVKSGGIRSPEVDYTALMGLKSFDVKPPSGSMSKEAQAVVDFFIKEAGKNGNVGGFRGIDRTGFATVKAKAMLNDLERKYIVALNKHGKLYSLLKQAYVLNLIDDGANPVEPYWLLEKIAAENKKVAEHIEVVKASIDAGLSELVSRRFLPNDFSLLGKTASLRYKIAPVNYDNTIAQNMVKLAEAYHESSILLENIENVKKAIAIMEALK